VQAPRICPNSRKQVTTSQPSNTGFTELQQNPEDSKVSDAVIIQGDSVEVGGITIEAASISKDSDVVRVYKTIK